MGNVDLETFTGRIITETSLAFLVKLEADGRELWIPKSLVSDAEELHPEPDTAIDMEVPQWLADREGLS